MDKKAFNFDGWDSDYIAYVYEGCVRWINSYPQLKDTPLYTKIDTLREGALKAYIEASK